MDAVKFFTEVNKAFAYKGLNLFNFVQGNKDYCYATGWMHGVQIKIDFIDVKDAKAWFEKEYDYAVEDAAALYEEM